MNKSRGPLRHVSHGLHRGDHHIQHHHTASCGHEAWREHHRGVPHRDAHGVAWSLRRTGEIGPPGRWKLPGTESHAPFGHRVSSISLHENIPQLVGLNDLPVQQCLLAKASLVLVRGRSKQVSQPTAFHLLHVSPGKLCLTQRSKNGTLASWAQTAEERNNRGG